MFTYLSLDEALILHEALARPVREALGTSGALYYAWVIPGVAFVLVVGLFFLPFVLGQEPWLRRLIVLSGALYVGGALGLELVGGALASNGLDDSWTFVAFGTVEEADELAGVSLFLYALLRNLEQQGVRLAVAVGSEEATP